jgi:hypothetical protein
MIRRRRTERGLLQTARIVRAAQEAAQENAGRMNRGLGERGLLRAALAVHL